MARGEGAYTVLLRPVVVEALRRPPRGPVGASVPARLTRYLAGANRGRGVSIFPSREPTVGEASASSRRGSQSWERRQHLPVAGANRGRGASIFPYSLSTYYLLVVYLLTSFNLRVSY
eukprot:2829-Prorocentrum_minimum.AAC.1